MNILFISNEYPPETGFGGIGTYTYQCAEALSKRGHAIYVICRSAQNIHSEIVFDNLTICRIPAGTYPLPAGRLFYPFRVWCRQALPHSLMRLAWAREVWAEVCRLEKTGVRFDLIEYPDCGAEGYWIARHRCHRLIARLHTPWTMARKLDKIREPFIDRLVMAFIERSVIVRAHMITSPTADLARKLRRRWRIGPAVVIPNPIAPAELAAGPKAGWIYTGRIEYRKGVHVLLRAYELLAQARQVPDLLLVGRPYGILPNGTPYGELIHSQIDNSGLKQHIRWIEGTTRDQVADHLRSSAVGIFPSLWENFPYACLEAMSCGLAIVASRCGGYTEMLVDNESALLCTPGNAEELAIALGRLCSEPDLAAALGSAAALRVQTLYTTEIVCPAMEQLYHKCASKAGRL